MKRNNFQQTKTDRLSTISFFAWDQFNIFYHQSGFSKISLSYAGFGLAFVAYPEAIAQLPASPFWALLFFLMLFTLGLDSQFTILETVCTAIIDAFPRQLRNRRWQLTLVLSVVMFLLGLSCVTEVRLLNHFEIKCYHAALRSNAVKYCSLFFSMF